MLSKSEKAQLIEIEKCERSTGRMKLEELSLEEITVVVIKARGIKERKEKEKQR